jgi:ABC-type multidrug transport system fused ATPase/permease subunit
MQLNKEARLNQTIQLKKYSQTKLLLRLFKNVIPYWDKYILIVLLQFIQGTIHALPILLLSKLPLFIGTGQTGDYIKFCLLMLFPAFLFRYVIFESLLNTLSWYIGLKLSLKFRQVLYRHQESLSLRFFQSRPVGEHLYRANVDIDSFVPLFNHPLNGFPMLISSVYQTILMAYLISVAGPEILFYLALVLIPIYTLVHILYSTVRKLDYNKRARAQELTAVLRDSIAGIRVIKAFDRVKFTIRRYFSAMVKYLKSTQAAYLMQVLVADLVKTSPVHIIWPLSLPFFAYLGLTGKIPIITWFGIIIFSRQMLYFLDLSFSFFQKLRLFLVPAQRYFETIDIQPEIIQSPAAKKLSELKGNLEFDDVDFSYQKGFPILNSISFKLEPSKKLAIIGASGAGKSTIANLALRLYDPENGKIKIDNKNLDGLNIKSILAQTGIILQDTFLFGGTIRDNIRYANPNATDEQVRQAAIDAGIHQDILDMPGGYDMDVAEGANLSGGQKQRIAIARALIKKPKLLLLDEATSSLDIATEDRIIETLQQNFKNIATIIISHRINLITDADEIIVLEKGKIVERGKHDELIQNKQLYYQFYRQQVDN